MFQRFALLPYYRRSYLYIWNLSTLKVKLANANRFFFNKSMSLLYHLVKRSLLFNPLSANPTKWLDTLKHFDCV